MNSRNSDFITNTRNVAREILSSVEKARALRSEYDALALGTNLDNGTGNDADVPEVKYGDFNGNNSDLTVTDIQNFFVTLQNIETMLAAGNATNLYKVK